MKEETKTLIKYILFTSDVPLTAREVSRMIMDYKYATETPSALMVSSYLRKNVGGGDKALRFLKRERKSTCISEEHGLWKVKTFYSLD